MNKFLIKIINERLKEELKFVKKEVKGCTSVMFGKEKETSLIVGKINGERFEVELFTQPQNLNHNDFKDIVEVLKKKYCNE